LKYRSVPRGACRAGAGGACIGLEAEGVHGYAGAAVWRPAVRCVGGLGVV
jgi:hypothetical protein